MGEEAEVKHFHKDLKRATEKVTAHNFLVIVGDFNAQVETELENYGFRGTALQWVRNYLSSRKQYVELILFPRCRK